MTNHNLNELVAMYVKFRDQRTALKRKYDDEDASLKDGMARLEVAMLGALAKQGANSINTDAGTVFKSTKSTCHVADWDSLLGYVKEHNLWHMLKRDVAKTAVVAFREENNDLPPGVDWREEVTVGVRRS